MSERKPVSRMSVWRVIRFICLVYLGLVVLMFLFQRMYIYYPVTDDLSVLETEAERYGLTAWRSDEGEAIGWRVPEGGTGPRIVVFHGNAGNALYRVHYLDFLADPPAGEAWDVRLFEYPGYGGREGRPSERAITETALAAVEELAEAEPGRPLYLLGESLGGGVATRVAAEHPEAVDGLLLLTPFTRLSDVGAAHFPFLPVRLLLREDYDNVENLRGYPGPVAVVLAEHDSVVPSRLGRELYEGFEGRKRLWEIEGADHNTLLDRLGTEVREELSAFLIEGE